MENIDFMGSDPRSEFRGCEKFGPSAVSHPKPPDFAIPPMGRSLRRPSVRPYPDLMAQPELLGSPLRMALGAKAADVAVLVRSATGQRNDVIRYGRLADNPDRSAITAEGFRP
jgi:hypothetical protein